MYTHTYLTHFEDFLSTILFHNFQATVYGSHLSLYAWIIFLFNVSKRVSTNFRLRNKYLFLCSVCMYCGFKTALLFVAQLLCVHKISTNFLRQSQPQIKYVFNFCIYHTCMHTANLKKSKVVNQTHNNYRLHFFSHFYFSLKKKNFKPFFFNKKYEKSRQQNIWKDCHFTIIYVSSTEGPLVQCGKQDQ